MLSLDGPRSRMASALLLPLAACLAVLLIIPTRGAAQSQNPPDKQDMPDQPVKAKPARHEKEPPPPANPLVKVNPEDGSGNDTKEYNKDGSPKQSTRKRPVDYGDFQSDPNDPRTMKHPRKLPVFGYDYFAPARQYIQARQAFLMRRYSGILPQNAKRTRTGTRRNTSTNTSNASQENTGTTTQGHVNAPYEQDQTATDNTTDRTARRRSNNQDDTGNGSNIDDTGSDRTTRQSDENGDMNSDENSSDTPDQMQRRSGSDTSGDDTGYDGSSDSSSPDDRVPSRYQAGLQDNGDNPNSGDNADNSDSTYPGTDTYSMTRAEVIRQENIRRELLGLPPLPDDTLYSGDTRTGDNSMSLNGRSTRTRSRSNQQDYYSDSYYNDRYSSDQYSAQRQPVDAFDQIADPITQMTRNITASVPASYQLSGGDKVIVRYSNPALAPRELTGTVDSQGNLLLGEYGHVNVAGMTLAQAEKAIQLRLSHYYKHVDVTLHLRELRTISVTVSGKVFVQGTYTVPAIATAFNLLYAAGGPTLEGSLRSVEVRRQGKTLTLDFYKMMAGSAPKGGDKPGAYQPDIPLQSGDVIYVPGSFERVSISGQVRNPAQYDLKEGETLQDALAYAGGVKASGVTHAVQVSTLDPGTAHVIKTVDLNDKAAVAGLTLYDGDCVNVLAVQPVVENKVTITGAVAQPSDYALTPGMRIRDLVAAARNPLPEAFLGHAELYRWNSDGTSTAISIDLAKALDGDPKANLPLMRWDKLEVYNREDAAFVGTRKLIVRGDVQRPGTYAYSAGMRVSDLLYKVGGPLPDAEMIVVEHQHGDGTKQYQQVSVADLTHHNQSTDIALEDNDIVAVYRNIDAQFIPEHKVSILGAVNGPGVYDRGEGMRLSNLLSYSGGFKPDAGNKVVVAHARRPGESSDANAQVTVLFDSQHRCAPQDDVALRDGDVVLVQGQGGFEDHPRIATIKGLVNHPGPYPITPTTHMSDLIAMAGGLRKEAFPEGAQFNRDPKMMASSEQRDLARIISDLSDLYNESDYKRQLAKSDLERIQAAGTASQSSTTVPLGGVAAPENPAAAALALELSKHDLVSRPRVLTDQDLAPTGNIAIDLPAALRHPGGNEDILLVDGDTITVPETPTTVQVVGAVVNPRGVKYEPGAGLDFYVEAAGGFAPDVARDHIVVIHAGGGLTPGNKVRTLRPGDVVYVPTRVLAEKLAGKSNSFQSFFSSLTSSAILFKLATGLFGL